MKLLETTLYLGNTPIANSEILNRSHAESHKNQSSSTKFRDRSEIFLWDTDDLVHVVEGVEEVGDYHILIGLEKDMLARSPRRNGISIHERGILSSNLPKFIGPWPNKRLIIDGGEIIPHAHYVEEITKLANIFQENGIDYLSIAADPIASPRIQSMIGLAGKYHPGIPIIF